MFIPGTETKLGRVATTVPSSVDLYGYSSENIEKIQNRKSTEAAGTRHRPFGKTSLHLRLRG